MLDVVLQRFFESNIFLYSTIVVIHHLFAIICFCFSLPKNKTDEKVFIKSFPFLTKFTICSLIIPDIFVLVFLKTSGIELIDQSLKFKTFFYFMFFTLLIMSLLIIKGKKEYLSRESEIKEKQPNLIVSIILIFYSFSVVYGSIITLYGNYLLDFTNSEEYTSTIISKESKSVRSGKYYIINIKPDVFGVSSLYVPRELYEEANGKKQIKLYVKNGFFGMPYISSNKILK